MNTATARKCFGFTSLRLDFVRASGACCALRTASGHWEMYKCDDGLEMFAGYAAGAAVVELERVYAAVSPLRCRVDMYGKSHTEEIETTLGTIAIDTTPRRVAA